MQKRIKILFDRFFAVVTLIFCLPILILTAISVYVSLGWPIYFCQTRTGINERKFTIIKFRTMTMECDSKGQLLHDEQRITSLGKLLRRLKLDELLQIINVANGDLSFVGPRPTIPEQVIEYNDFERLRLNVLPGITGWAQVHGNIQLTWPERILMDIWYIEHWSLWLDFIILIKTVGVIILGEHPVEKKLEEAKTHANYTRRGC